MSARVARVARVAALYDVHGNLPALEAALAAIDADAGGVPDLIVVGGDAVLGPMPRETLDRLLDLGDRARFVRGNCDRLVVDAFDGRSLSALPPAVQQAFEWTAARLDRRHRDALAAFPPTLTVDLPSLGAVLFCHATPRSDEEILTAITPIGRVRPMLAGVGERTVVGGHTHMQYDRTVDGVRVVNAGSVGMPHGATGAHWLMLGPEVRFVRTAYDLDRAATLVRQTGFPDADGFVERHLRHPAAEAEMQRLFDRMPRREADDAQDGKR